MKKAIITFEKCIQDSQEYGSNDEHMISRIFFSISMPNKIYNLHADIKQIVGSNYETDPLEVFLPKNFKENLNYDQFRNIVEKYFRTFVGKTAKGIHIKGGDVRMQNNTFSFPMSFELEIPDKETGW